MKSIQNKFILLIMSCIILSAATIGGVGILHATRLVDTDSEEIMELTCREQARKMDMIFKSIESSVDMLSAYAEEQLESVEKLKQDEEYRDSYTQQLSQIFGSIAGQTDGAVAYYVRYNPEFVTADSGLFYTRQKSGAFRAYPLTDLSAYEPTDAEHVGWYYIPVQKGEPVWIEPYWNENIDVYMISYVEPLYLDGKLFGVAGMDIDFNFVEDWVDGVTVYDTGTAFLADSQGQLLYQAGQQDEGQEPGTGSTGDIDFYENSKVTFCDLANGMRLGLKVPIEELNRSRQVLIYQICGIAAGIAVLFILLTTLMTRRLVRPLKELTAAAKKVAEGRLDIELSCRTKDEIASLTASFQETVSHLQKYISYINGLAYQDALTGVKNKTAYREAVVDIEKRLKTEQPELAVVVMDVNGLKQVNDSYGHDAGDRLLIGASRMIESVFRNSPVYRIGGDEFVILLEGQDLDNAVALFERLEQAMEQTNENTKPEQRISIAWGIALYNPKQGQTYMDLFQYADKAMYEKKAKMKRGWNRNAGAV